MPTLVLVAGFSQKVAQGTALLAMIIPTARASQAHLKLQHVALPLLPGLIAGAVAGGFLGANIALNVPEVTLRLICSFIFACIGLRYLFAR